MVDIQKDQYNYSDGIHYYGGWIGFIILLLPTLISNLTVFFLVTFSPHLNKSLESYILKFLMLEDAGFSLFCLTQCIINLSHMTIYGSDIGCVIQSIYATFFVLSAGYTLCLISYNIDLKIHMKSGLSRKQILKLHLMIWCWSLIIAFIGSYIFSPRLIPSSTYCLSSLLELGSGLLFFIPGVGIISVFLIHRYFKIYLYIKKTTNNLHSGHDEARIRQIAVFKKIFIFILCYFICALPVLIVNLIELITGEILSPAMHLLAGHLIHLNSLFDPLLYFWLNKKSRDVFWYHVKMRCERNRILPLNVTLEHPPFSIETKSSKKSIENRSIPKSENKYILSTPNIIGTELTSPTE